MKVMYYFHRWYDQQNDLMRLLVLISIASLTFFGHLGMLIFGLMGLSRINYVQQMQGKKMLWERILDAI
jgi:hypothetical protein